MRGRLAIVVVALLGATSCANSAVGAGAGAAPGTSPAPDFPKIDWSNPFGVSAASVGDVSGELAFTPKVPADLGNYVSISASDPSSTDRPDRVLAWVYNDATYGQFFVEELLPTETQNQLETSVSCQPGEVGCDTTGSSLVTIRGGVTALLIYAPPDWSVATALVWLEGGLEYIVMGPRSSLTDHQVLSIAKNV